MINAPFSSNKYIIENFKSSNIHCPIESLLIEKVKLNTTTNETVKEIGEIKIDSAVNNSNIVLKMPDFDDTLS